MRGRLSVVALAALLPALAACATSDGDEPTAATTSRASVARTTTERQGERGGGLLDALGSLFGQDEIGRCVDEAASGAGDSRPTGLRAIAREVERIRRLRFRSPPRPRYLPRAKMEREIRRELDKYPSDELAAETRALVALGAIPPRTNLRALLKRTLPGQIAGFYDPATRELVVGGDADRRLDALERLTLAHELEHALADQRLRLPRYLQDDRIPDGNEDVELAGIALVEGDATLLTEAFASEHLSLADAFRSIGPAIAAQRDFEELPYYLQASTLFPYGDGLAFVCSVFGRGGWKAVDRAYRRPPTTSAEILFPERYFARAKPVDAPDPVAPRGWRLIDAQAFGAANLLWLLEAPRGDTDRAVSDARRRTAAWAGGELHVWGRRGRTRVTLTLVQRRTGGDLCASVRAWFRAADRRGSVRCSARLVRANLHP